MPSFKSSSVRSLLKIESRARDRVERMPCSEVVLGVELRLEGEGELKAVTPWRRRQSWMVLILSFGLFDL